MNTQELNKQSEFNNLINEWIKSNKFEEEIIETSKQSIEIIEKLEKLKLINIKVMNKPFII